MEYKPMTCNSCIGHKRTYYLTQKEKAQSYGKNYFNNYAIFS